MKTQHKHKMSLSRTVPDKTSAEGPRPAGRNAAAGSATSGPLCLLTGETTEQSENVYENKGQGQKVAESYGEIQRDEFDNTNELIGLLENGGLDLVARARDARSEDTFVIGPDVVGALRQKAQLMRREAERRL
jgi:hypothetical protein